MLQFDVLPSFNLRFKEFCKHKNGILFTDHQVVYGGVSVRFLEMVQVNNQEFTAESPAAQDVSKFKVSIVISS